MKKENKTKKEPCCEDTENCSQDKDKKSIFKRLKDHFEKKASSCSCGGCCS